MIMRKMTKLLTMAAMLLAPLALTSCEELFSLFDNPSPTPTEETTEVTVTYNATGATVTASEPSQITEVLTTLVDDIASKVASGDTYKVDIKTGTESPSTTEVTISVPKVADSDINLNFEAGVTTEVPLVIKAAETASTTPTTAVDKLTVTMPASTSGISLELTMPETTVTLKAASGTVVYDEVVATTAINTLYIESGVTVKNLQVKGGIVVVKDGGKAETYVCATPFNEYEIHHYPDGPGVEPLWFDFDGSGTYKPNVQYENGNAYTFQNLKIIKGEADYSWLVLSNNNNPLTSLTIAKDATVRFDEAPFVKKLVGEGDGTALLGTSTYTEGNFYGDEIVPSIDFQMTLFPVELLSNVTVGPIVPAGNEKAVQVSILDVPAISENCIYRCNYLILRPVPTGFPMFKNCKFDATTPYSNIKLWVANDNPSSPTTYSYAFEGCEFSKEFALSNTEYGKGSDFSNFTLEVTFNNCKYDGAALTKDSEFLTRWLNKFKKATNKFIIDGKTYLVESGALVLQE